MVLSLLSVRSPFSASASLMSLTASSNSVSVFDTWTFRRVISSVSSSNSSPLTMPSSSCVSFLILVNFSFHLSMFLIAFWTAESSASIQLKCSVYSAVRSAKSSLMIEVLLLAFARASFFSLAALLLSKSSCSWATVEIEERFKGCTVGAETVEVLTSVESAVSAPDVWPFRSRALRLTSLLCKLRSPSILISLAFQLSMTVASVPILGEVSFLIPLENFLLSSFRSFKATS